MTMPATLRISLFGPMQALVDGQPLPPLRSRKSLWLLALLTLRRGRPVERAWLAEVLWPDSYPDQASANFNPALSDLRRALGDQAVRLHAPSRHTLQLDLTDADVDLAEFDAAILSQELAAMERAVALYRGPLLEDCSEEWAIQERDARQQDCLRALGTLAEIALTAGDHGKSADYYRRAVAISPQWEAAQRGLMQALSEAGDSNAALDVYQSFVRLLRRDDPKAIPDEKTTALYTRLRAEARQRIINPTVATIEDLLVPLVTGYLPHPVTDLVGREEERLEVVAQLRRSRLMTLIGPGGIGKTRLALAVAADAALEYANGVWFVSLESLSDGELVAGQIARVLGVKEEPSRTILESVTDHLRTKQLLLILDNCEHLLEASAQVAWGLLRECTGLQVLATSRESLRITGETAWPVPPLSVPDTTHLTTEPVMLVPALISFESIRLFHERAQAAEQTFALTPESAPIVAQVCVRLEGIPLAIELAAARVKAMPLEQIASRLDDRLGLLTGGSHAALPRQQTLRATLDWSYDLLSETERLLLARLSVFAGGWTLEASEQVCCCEIIPDWEVLDLLTSLVDKSLVVFEPHAAENQGRYRMLETVRQYAAECLLASGEMESLRARHRNWLLEIATAANQNWVGADHEQWRRRLEAEYDNLRLTLDQSSAEQVDLQRTDLQMAGLLTSFWEERGDYRLGRHYLSRALAQDSTRLPTKERAKALNGAGSLAFRQGDYASARLLHEECLSLWRKLEIPISIAASLGNLGNVFLYQGDYNSASTLYEESLRIRQELGDKNGIAFALENLGTIRSLQGDFVGARVQLSESLKMRRELGDKSGIAFALSNLGNVIVSQGDYAEAQVIFEEGLALFRELSVVYGIAWTLNSLGSLALRQDNAEASKTLHQESLDLYRKMGETQGTGQSLYFLGVVASHRGDHISAQTHHQESLKLFRDIGYIDGVEGNLRTLAPLLFSRGDLEKSVWLWASASALRDTLSSKFSPGEAEEHSQQVGQARTAMGEDVFTATWEAGLALTWEQAAAYALDEGLVTDAVSDFESAESASR